MKYIINKIMPNSVENIHNIRNARRFGSLGLYGRERGELFAKWLGSGKKILELGCRDGSLTKLFSHGNQMIGADIDKNALVEFEKNIGRAVYLDLNNDWLFEKEEFDAVVASEVLEHLYQPQDIIAKVAKSIKFRGLFIGSIPNGFSLINRIRLFMARPDKTALADPTHVHQFSHKELKNILKKYFKEVRIVPIGRLSFLDKFFPGMFSFLILFRCKK